MTPTLLSEFLEMMIDIALWGLIGWLAIFLPILTVYCILVVRGKV